MLEAAKFPEVARGCREPENVFGCPAAMLETCFVSRHGMPMNYMNFMEDEAG